MKPEIEAKFLDVNHDELREKLKALGAVCEQPMRLMRRVTIDNEQMKSKDAFLRVRDEGDKTTITYKQFDSLSVDGAKEIETTVGDFATIIKLLEAVGLKARSFQESKREAWRANSCEIVLDEWPWLKPYIEIEGPDIESVKRLADQLGFAWSQAVFGDVMAAYRAEYSHLSEKDTVGNIAEVKFGDPLPEMLKN